MYSNQEIVVIKGKIELCEASIKELPLGSEGWVLDKRRLTALEERLAALEERLNLYLQERISTYVNGIIIITINICPIVPHSKFCIIYL